MSPRNAASSPTTFNIKSLAKGSLYSKKQNTSLRRRWVAVRTSNLIAATALINLTRTTAKEAIVNKCIAKEAIVNKCIANNRPSTVSSMVVIRNNKVRMASSTALDSSRGVSTVSTDRASSVDHSVVAVSSETAGRAELQRPGRHDECRGQTSRRRQ